jgi:hypothetical protein
MVCPRGAASQFQVGLVVQFRLRCYTFREPVSSAVGNLFNTKNKKRGKKCERKRETIAFEEERKCYGLDQYYLQQLLHLLFKFVLTWHTTAPLLMSLYG